MIKMFEQLRVKTKLAILIAISLAGLLGYAALAYSTRQQVQIQGEFYRELVGLRHLSWPQLLGRPWETTTLMVRSALDMLRETGLLAVDGQRWELLAAPAAPIDVTTLASWRAYREAHEFRLLLANGSAEAVRAALSLDRGRVLTV